MSIVNTRTFNSVEQAYRGPKRKVKKSRFIASIYPITQMKDVEEALKKVQEEHNKASHNAWAYRIVENQVIRADCSDDGEVKGTAGEPILNVIGNRNFANVLVVVTRYYGGINLGPAGLLREYSQTALDLIENIPVMPLSISEEKA